MKDSEGETVCWTAHPPQLFYGPATGPLHPARIRAKAAEYRLPGSTTVIICSCNVLSDHDVRTAMATSAPPRTTGEFFRYFGRIAPCGRCARSIRHIMDGPTGIPVPPSETGVKEQSDR
jgi:bacterioferritin-associated ferredoxin